MNASNHTYRPEPLRMTNQRKGILEEVQKARQHLTADEVYELVRKKQPRISLSTVYRNLEKMADAGILARLELSGNQRRYDWNTDMHHHARCVRCGAVRDVPVDAGVELDLGSQAINGFAVSGFRLEFKGICEKCR
ncbi:Fur family transcriptional regulator, ferric uptake regulator [Desulfatibacillum alkenivorans DSM 16219]|jgi:Fur family ferric uptake transcriptional regulator|uniref:Fur family transcriptional regulator, ferric uptake regulator n=2 Tax=Desulfatibacillum alkenivorans TaxID=259354 RepID=A0A1M6E9M3_9BACT|nr:Fur family transcriptional regulator, ferric uptake regulator [Desulfatibacillum alkenivorans DSM 16219]